jgi:transposase
MYIRTTPRKNGKTAIQIVESRRVGKKVNQKVIRHVGQATNDEELKEIRKLAAFIISEFKKNKEQLCLPLLSPEKISEASDHQSPADDPVIISNLREQQRITLGIADVFGKIYDTLGFSSLLFEAGEKWHSILKQCVIARVANPSSKRRTALLLEEDYGVKLPVHKIYRMMDRLYKVEDQVKSAVLNSTLSLLNDRPNVDVLFFDVTTLYFESFESDDLKSSGFSKDAKFKEVQVVFALVTTTEGQPITYELFPGNTYEGHTLITTVENLEKKFSVKNVIMVADRGIFNDDNLSAMEAKGIKYVVGARLKSLPKLMKQTILNSSLFSAVDIEDELHWVQDFAYGNRRLVVSYSSTRAKKDASDRQRLIDRLLKKVKNQTVPIREVVPNRGTAKFLKIEGGKATIDVSKISTDQQWDGLHGVITNMKEEKAQWLLSRYRGLWQIEEAFRINKHDLKMRPIFHWSEERIRAHITICFLAYCLTKQAIHRIGIQYSKMSFEEIRNHLAHVQASLTIDTSTDKMYLLPSKVTDVQKRIYSIFGLRLTDIPSSILDITTL